MTPIRFTPAEPGRVYRKISYGPMLEVFFLDLRSYRGPNSDNVQTELTDESRILGVEQVAWLKRELAQSSATWKVIASDMPIGLVVGGGQEAIGNGDNGAAKGRELEIADLLRFIKNAGITNTVWFTADVHYTAAHYYDPSKAQFQDFNENGQHDDDEPIIRSGNHSWFVAHVQRPGEQRAAYVIAVMVEYGGSGGRVSGPVCNQVLHALKAEGYL